MHTEEVHLAGIDDAVEETMGQKETIDPDALTCRGREL